MVHRDLSKRELSDCMNMIYGDGYGFVRKKRVRTEHLVKKKTFVIDNSFYVTVHRDPTVCTKYYTGSVFPHEKDNHTSIEIRILNSACLRSFRSQYVFVQWKLC